MTPTWRIEIGDALERLREMPSGSVHMIATSPPYFALRDYKAEGQLGMERTVEEYIARLVGIFDECKRVLRRDGVVFLNLGDTYHARPRGSDKGWDTSRLSNPGSQSKAQSAALRRPELQPPRWHAKMRTPATRAEAMAFALAAARPRLKHKDLIGVPWRVALALRDRGWYLRSDIIWSAENRTPESVIDRCSRQHEYVFMLSRSRGYFYDSHAVRVAGTNRAPGNTSHKHVTAYAAGDESMRTKSGLLRMGAAATRNLRTVWRVNTVPYEGDHFAVWPPALVVPMIKAGTSERGCCPTCAAPWYRRVERAKCGEPGCPCVTGEYPEVGDARNGGLSKQAQNPEGRGRPQGFDRDVARGMTHREYSDWLAEHPERTVGWDRRCRCEPSEEEPTPAVVLDPFCGSGTTGAVAIELGRSFVGIDIDPRSAVLARGRISSAAETSGRAGDLEASILHNDAPIDQKREVQLGLFAAGSAVGVCSSAHDPTNHHD